MHSMNHRKTNTLKRAIPFVICMLLIALLPWAINAEQTATDTSNSEQMMEGLVKELTGENLRAEAPQVADQRKEYPLRGLDTSSPRATLGNYLQIMEVEYAHLIELLESYLASSRLYMLPAEEELIERGNRQIDLAARAFATEGLPPALLGRDLLRRKAIQLKGIMNRLDLPAPEEIPDAAQMAERDFKRWTIPDTEIVIALVVSGERAGEYLFTPASLERLDEFYERILHLPPRAGSSVGWYKSYNYGAGGLRKIVPYRWILQLPDWAKARTLDQPLWRWAGTVIVLLGAALLLTGVRWLQKGLMRRSEPRGPTLLRHWAPLLTPLALIALLPLIDRIFDQNLRLSSDVGSFFDAVIWGTFFLILTWTVWRAGSALSESIISSQHLEKRGVDSQLVRFGLRIVVIMLAVVILVEGAYRIGLPAYSVFAGLGISGIAVALAARESLSNLLSSLIIMFEKPFRVGHWIKTSEAEGIVETINFRSTRIRTFYNSLVSIPNNKLVETTVDNMQLRLYRRQRFTVQITYGTPSAQMRRFVEGIKQIILDNEHTRKDYFLVSFNDLGAHSLDILVNFFLIVPDHSAELAEREDILFRIVALAEELGIEFAFPTQTVHVEGTGLAPASQPG